ncbi:uncharacterized protein NFIA_059670 [Aspergillus fischeri NRRL 181]|uniref:Uncharacterized protein n=1 Tax=Neosartorya fischeri (strain ATCC 1020 / DSM 3700 / CBS 544.65 / FGSC A1164 / JCM 1740 / NRRL 181 / WB 181) TaxID=331117 RepID=A1DP91_NEOFI|nr:conserved hypothetical protein [Aspergillus fischeri NRRL 181]EAW16612.1 conserved hypothetical protein [Aspergillus fischeri NRRL 181]KAG2024403.1 hypothetical protein GB937_004060 [Aspergillus fischeri]
MSSDSMHSRPRRGRTPTDPTQFPQRFFLKVKNDILSVNGPGFLSYTNIEPEIGSQVAISLDCDKEIEERSVYINFNSVSKEFHVTMPTGLHMSVLPWLKNEFALAGQSGFFSVRENSSLPMSSGTRFDSFAPPYAMSFKEPDAYIQPKRLPLPTVVFEVGYSESYPRLLRDKDLWVNVVILIKWSLLAQSRIKGRVEAWRKNQPAPLTFVRGFPLQFL